MDRGRIAAIRELADRAAVYVVAENDRRFFRGLATERHYDTLRGHLIRANERAARLGMAPFLTYDLFIAVFEEGEEVSRNDWRLARDLVLIRMIEQLHAQGWLARHPDVLPELSPEEGETAEGELVSRDL